MAAVHSVALLDKETLMNRSVIAVLGIAVLFAAGTTLAQDAKAPAGKAATQTAMGMDSRAQMGQMDEQISRMQALHDKMASAKTPEERQKLMEEQRKSMQSGMGMMNQMRGGMMGGGGAMMGQQAAPSDTNAQMQLMGKRMDMMQMMMQTMMDQQGMMGGANSAGGAPRK
ncbi:MAG: hypothetical protein M3R43_09875 [Acidobacteriota bacterium]|nr:hypothetical protein [Acidobacteriota bacterium]